MKYLLDSNFLIGLLRGTNSYWEFLERLVQEALPSISVLSRTEVFAGCHPHEVAATTSLVNRFESIAVYTSIADLAGKYVYGFRKRGLILHLEDALIGATAVQEGLILVTRNMTHFPMLTLGKNLILFPDKS
ncbi:type II toxin-antitoxin system VapC family toxin [Desulfobacterota bacterium AH_259_B03_O07]|nr:type II toxin-antitoxin system VapC family toxin [Desulfobacterota bacterium AH_259_B03_O07]